MVYQAISGNVWRLMTMAAQTAAICGTRQRLNDVANVIAASTAEYAETSMMAIRRDVARTGVGTSRSRI